MNSPCRFLFVYGTLRHDSPHPMATFLASQARFIGAATMPGRLFNLGPFPGMRPPEKPGEVVHGHLFEMNDPAGLLFKLDEYEAVPQGLPEPPEFERSVLTAHTDDGREVQTWVYRYVGPLNGAQQIMSGHYIEPR